MSNEVTVSVSAVQMWEEQKDIIRKTIAPDATEAEFQAFCSYGQAIGANPLKKELFFIKFKGKVSMVVARDFHRKRAQEQATHRGQTVECIYSNDNYQVQTTLDGLKIAHSRGISDRGKLLGAYSLTYDDRLPVPHFEEVLLENYVKTFGVWKDNPEAMIKKVASAVGYRAVYTGVLGSVYSEAEQWLEKKPQVTDLAMAALEPKKEVLAIEADATEPEPETEPATPHAESFEEKKARLKAEAMAGVSNGS